MKREEERQLLLLFVCVAARTRTNVSAHEVTGSDVSRRSATTLVVPSSESHLRKLPLWMLSGREKTKEKM
jgi:hypothetical protein